MSFTTDWDSECVSARLDNVSFMGVIDIYQLKREVHMWDAQSCGFDTLNYDELGRFIKDLQQIREMIAPITPEDPDQYGEGPDYPY